MALSDYPGLSDHINVIIALPPSDFRQGASSFLRQRRGIRRGKRGPMGDWKLSQTLGDLPASELVDGKTRHSAPHQTPCMRVRRCPALLPSSIPNEQGGLASIVQNDTFVLLLNPLPREWGGVGHASAIAKKMGGIVGGCSHRSCVAPAPLKHNIAWKMRRGEIERGCNASL